MTTIALPTASSAIQIPPTIRNPDVQRRNIHRAWINMMQRCNNPAHPNYKYYGARGIKVCQRWMESWLNFLADMGLRPAGKVLDRIDNDGDYEPSNCRWTSRDTSMRNRRHKYTSIWFQEHLK